MEAFLIKNEAENNELVSKVSLAIGVFVIMTGAFCVLGIFDVAGSIALLAVGVSAIPLVLPAVLIYGFHVNRPWLKYLLITMLSLLIGTYYCIFTFQAILVFVIPSILAALYMDKRLLLYLGCLMCVVIIAAHAVTGIYLFQPWMEPFTDMQRILQYGALPRCMQYLLCFGLLLVLNRRHLDYMEKTAYMAGEDTALTENPLRKELDTLISLLTGREKEVFLLMADGATNRQIADRLCLSMGTVKNYVSVIYEKAGNRERNYFILKYSRFIADYDQSHSKS